MADEDLKTFLRERGIGEDTIMYINEEKIDESVFLIMPEEKLADLFPKVGDRLAVIDFCRRRSRPTSKKQSLIEKLKNKLEEKKTTKGSSDVNVNEKKNATKLTRKIEISWLDWKVSTNRYVQVRTKQGGGTRFVDVNKDATKREVLDLALKIFFKDNGTSTRGHTSQFTFDLFDFEEQQVIDNISVGEMYISTMLPKLRFYLASKKNREIMEGDILYNSINNVVNDYEISGPSHTNYDGLRAISPHIQITSEDLSGVEQTSLHQSRRAYHHENSSGLLHRGIVVDEHFPTEVLLEIPSQSGLLSPIVQTPSRSDLQSPIAQTLSQSDLLYPIAQTLSQSDLLSPIAQTLSQSDLQSPTVQTPSRSDLQLPIVQTPSRSDLQSSIVQTPSRSDPQSPIVQTPSRSDLQSPINLPNTSATTLTLHRGRVLEEMTQAFMHDKTINKIIVEMVLPNGEIEKGLDSRGVLRDSISEYWTSFYEKYTIGTRAKVPYLRHDLSYKEWVAAARILKMGWNEEGYLPIKLAAPFLEQCFFGTFHTDLVETLLKFLSESEEEVLRKALTDFKSVDTDEVVEILQNFDCRWIPTQLNLYTLLYDIAHQEFIQKPMFVIDAWSVEVSNLISHSQLKTVFLKITPNLHNILALLRCEDKHEEKQNRIVKFLKRFLKESDDNTLASFSRFCSGSDLAINPITINIVTTDSGLKRSPIAHTCASILDIPVNYENFVEFRNEFNSILQSKIWVMDIL